MATITRENIAPLTDKLIVEVKKDEYLPSFEKSLKQYAKKANIPGFRKGMVPSGLIKKMYGSSLFGEEVVKEVEKELSDYLKQEDLKIFGQPLPFENEKVNLDVNNPSDYSFAFEIGLQPEFEVNYRQVPVVRYNIQVSESDIDKEIEQIRKQQEKQNPAEAIENEDSLFSFELIPEGSEKTSGKTMFDDFSLTSFDSETAESLKGKKVGDSITLQISQITDQEKRKQVSESLKSDSGEEAVENNNYQLIIKAIYTKEPAELNEELFKKIFPAKEITTEEEFRSALKEDYERVLSQESKNQLHDQLYHSLIDDTQIAFPEQFIKRWLKEGEQERTDEEAEKEYPRFINQLKWSQINNKIISENNITVEPDEIRENIKKQLLGYFSGIQDSDASWLDEYVNKMMKDQKQVEQNYMQILTNKLFEFLEQNASVTEENISLDDFNAKLRDHHHHH